MNKKFLTVFFCIILLTISSGCNKQKSIILFNTEPISKQNLFNNSTHFPAGQRIYYIFISKKPIIGDILRVQVTKFGDMDSKTWSEIVYANDFKRDKDQYYYYTNYVVINKKGRFLMQIFATDKLYEALGRADFYVD